ncbi:MAG: FeoC-like transcriptional regulator [Chloroflexi bacterium]|nr:FeoC-like transcriptional regulator [Chloroflexota bacterium]
MLTQLLLAIGDSAGSTHAAELARRLGTSETLVSAMLEQLVRMGYLVETVPGCDMACASCPARCEGCRPTAPVKLWRLTPAGLHALGRTA